MKAIVIVVPEDTHAPTMARLLAATLSMNGYLHDGPSVIDWPVLTERQEPDNANTEAQIT